MSKTNRHRRPRPAPPAKPEAPRSAWRTVAICCGLAGIVWLVFAQTANYDFVNYDDDVYVSKNAAINRGFSLGGLAWAFTHVYAANWHPLTWISHMTDCALWGVSPGPHHLTNVLIHSVNAALLFLVLARMTRAIWRSAFVAAVFAVHPLRVESVAWIAERKDVLSGLFFFLTLASYVRYVRQPKSLGRYFVVMTLLALGLMSKPSLVVTPIILLLLDYWPLQRLFPRDSVQYRHPLPATSTRRVLLEKVPLLGLSAGSAAVTLIAQKYSVTVGGGLPIVSRVQNALISYFAYVRQMLWPTRLSILYPHPGINQPLGELILACLILVLISIAVFILRKTHRYLLTGWLWYLVTLVPTIGLIQVGFQSRADRYTYLSHIGLCIMAAWSIPNGLRLGRNQRFAVATGATAVVLLLASLAYLQCAYWRNGESLWTHTLQVTSGNPVAHNNLGNFYLDHEQLDQALQQYQASLAISAPVANQTRTLGLMERAYADAENNLGMVLVKTGRERDGIDCYQRVLARFPDNPKAHLNMGNVLLDHGRGIEAIEHYRKALTVFPRYADAHFNLGNALLQKENFDAAVSEYQEALKIEPDLLQAHNNLGIGLLNRGDVRGAITQWRQALRLQPNSVDALNNVAWIEATYPDPGVRNGREAAELAAKANQLSAQPNPSIIRTAAAASAEMGDFAAAISAAQRAAQLARASNNEALAGTLEDDLTHYRHAEPIRTSPRPENSRSP